MTSAAVVIGALRVKCPLWGSEGCDKVMGKGQQNNKALFSYQFKNVKYRDTGGRTS